MNNFFGTNIGAISQLVEDQFPAFYKEHGPAFIDFIEAYYEWLESDDNPIGKARGLYSQFDIDTVSDEFLKHYQHKYMWGLPPELLGNQRLLQKHILELYRSKGSQQATRLLFRLLFNEDIEFYIPSYDIFKLSDNTWVEPHYLEVTYSSHFDKYVNGVITGATSGATAVVESYESRYINGRTIHILFISNITGRFVRDESVLTNDVHSSESPVILGSFTGLDITNAPSGMPVGHVLTSTNSDYPARVVVSEVTSGTGILTFRIDNPGSYYSLDTIITTPVTPVGSGAQIRVASLRDTHQYHYVHDKILPYVGIPLNGTYPFPAEPNSDLNTVIADSLVTEDITVGTIDKIQVLNPGKNYEEIVYFYPVDPYTSISGIIDGEGNPVGKNAVIVGTPIIGDNIPSMVNIISSGYNIKDEMIEFKDEMGASIMGNIIRGAVGKDEGYFLNTKSFLSNDKYLFDGHYYQDFSYVIQASKTLDKYIDILKLLVHPAGNAIYGDVRLLVENSLYNQAVVTRINITPVVTY